MPKEKSTELTEHMLHASDKLEAEFAALEIFFLYNVKKQRIVFLVIKKN